MECLAFEPEVKKRIPVSKYKNLSEDNLEEKEERKRIEKDREKREN